MAYAILNSILSGIELPVILMGDMNAHIAGIAARTTNENGRRLMALQEEYDLTTLNHDEGTAIELAKSFCLDYCLISKDLAEEVVDFHVDSEGELHRITSPYS